MPCAGEDGVVTLYRGGCFSEEEAVAKLADYAATYTDRTAWTQRADRIRRGLRTGLRLDKLPVRNALNPILRGVREMDGYTVENVAFESVPGFWVTGNLYRPTGGSGPYPGLLCPHGHWVDGRMRPDMQIRCAALARMGAVVFTWDLVGFGESDPVDHQNVHALRLSAWNAIRSVDFLLSLGDVDPERLAVTGASGGGTQTFLLAALDERIAVSVPTVMVSAHFYGGCVCESGLPIHKSAAHETNNVEISALFAPKPQLIVSDGQDWTKNTPRVEFPYIRNVYALYGAEDRVENAHFAEEGHDYGPSKRRAAYTFLARHLGLDLGRVRDADGAIAEDFVRLQEPKQLRVFNDQHPRPDHALKRGDEVIRQLDRR